MQEPVYVTEIVKEEPSFPYRHVVLPLNHPPTSIDERIEWQKENSWLIDYSVDKRNLQEAKYLATKLQEVKNDKNKIDEENIIKRLWELRSKSWEEKTDLEKWAHMTVQKPGDWGPASWAKKCELRNLVTELCSGRVLEPMCGFRSYIGDSEKIKEVVALDFCREALERYERPERKEFSIILKT